jgi:hypothetical protein
VIVTLGAFSPPFSLFMAHIYVRPRLPS